MERNIARQIVRLLNDGIIRVWRHVDHIEPKSWEFIQDRLLAPVYGATVRRFEVAPADEYEMVGIKGVGLRGLEADAATRRSEHAAAERENIRFTERGSLSEENYERFERGKKLPFSAGRWHMGRIHVCDQNYMTLSQASRLPFFQIKGRRVKPRQLLRWAEQGAYVYRKTLHPSVVRLETMRVADGLITSLEAVRRFLEALYDLHMLAWYDDGGWKHIGEPPPPMDQKWIPLCDQEIGRLRQQRLRGVETKQKLQQAKLLIQLTSLQETIHESIDKDGRKQVNRANAARRVASKKQR